jgi:transcription antitermination factor NusG
MANFQRAVACFTSDVEVSLVHTDGLEIGRRVRLLSGPFEGCEGVIENEEEGGALRSFLIRFTSDNALKVKLSVDETNIEPIE